MLQSPLRCLHQQGLARQRPGASAHLDPHALNCHPPHPRLCISKKLVLKQSQKPNSGSPLWGVCIPGSVSVAVPDVCPRSQSFKGVLLLFGT